MVTFSPCLGPIDSFVLKGVRVVVVCLVFKLTADEIYNVKRP